MFFAVVVRPTMLYGSECWPIKKVQQNKLEVQQSRVLRWALGIKWQDKLENEYVRFRVEIESMGQRLRENRLQWFGHVVQLEGDDVIKRVRKMQIPGEARGRGRPRMTWDAVVKKDMAECELHEEMALDRSEWRVAIRIPTLAMLGVWR